MTSESPYLYRALRPAEIMGGNVLIPKTQGPFQSDPRLEIDTRLPFVLGPTEEHAVRQHQWKQHGYPTSGISTTPHLTRAVHYAQENRIVVKINRSKLPQFGIREYIVEEFLGSFPSDIACPEDNEVILVSGQDSSFPKEIIEEVINLDLISPK